ncbi:MAG: flagellin [Methanoregula sp.]|nr:flagellin [Methanoregula sp.]
MSAETITTAIFLITAVVATAVLVNAIYPVIYSTAGTFQSSTHDADTRLRTDFKIVATFAKSPNVQVWMKNIGSQRISLAEIQKADVFCGEVGNFGRLNYIDGTPNPGKWTEIFTITTGDLNNNDYWDTGETLEIYAQPSIMPSSGNLVYFQFILPNGIWRSNEFTAS